MTGRADNARVREAVIAWSSVAFVARREYHSATPDMTNATNAIATLETSVAMLATKYMLPPISSLFAFAKPAQHGQEPYRHLHRFSHVGCHAHWSPREGSVVPPPAH